MDLDFQFQMATPVYRPIRMPPISPTPIIIPDIILIVPIWDGAVTRGINITTTTITIGGTIDQVIIIKDTPMAINGTTSVTITENTIETITGVATRDANCDDKLIVRTGGKVGRAN